MVFTVNSNVVDLPESHCVQVHVFSHAKIQCTDIEIRTPLLTCMCTDIEIRTPLLTCTRVSHLDWLQTFSFKKLDIWDSCLCSFGTWNAERFRLESPASGRISGSVDSEHPFGTQFRAGHTCGQYLCGSLEGNLGTKRMWLQFRGSRSSKVVRQGSIVLTDFAWRNPDEVALVRCQCILTIHHAQKYDINLNVIELRKH